jgi:beta-phosphoglucomutase
MGSKNLVNFRIGEKHMRIKAVIFDLDGVIVSTDEYHFQAWKSMADEEGIYFDREINEMLRGVSRMESLDIILRKSAKIYGMHEKLELAQRKNDFYRELLKKLTPEDILPGVEKVLGELKESGIKVAIGSSSKNTPFILQKIGLSDYFDAVADGNEIKNSKPDPEVFLLAAKKLELSTKLCLVVEDADAGVEAALAGGMKVVGVGAAAYNEKAHYKVRDLSLLNFKEIIV